MPFLYYFERGTKIRNIRYIEYNRRIFLNVFDTFCLKILRYLQRRNLIGA
jgi:hypothetical protein